MKFLLLALLIVLSTPVMSQTNWQLVKQRNNISVYTRLETGSLYKSFKAVSFVSSSPREIFEVLGDVNGYKKWFAFAKAVRLLEHSENTKYVYMETGFPWPFSNEDMVYKISSTSNKDGTIKLILDGEPDFIPSHDGVVRMLDAKGYISLYPEKDQTKITYFMHAELGGNIPPMLANSFIHELPLSTLENLIKMVRKKVN